MFQWSHFVAQHAADLQWRDAATGSALALFAALESLPLAPALDAAIRKFVMVAFFWQAGLWASTVATAWLDQQQLPGVANGKAKASSIGILRFGVRAVIWAMVVLLTLENLGTDITALVAGLGIGGVAIALALQNVLGDLLASLSITLDQPFVVGDAIASGDHTGTVEYIGIKSTRLRSLLDGLERLGIPVAYPVWRVWPPPPGPAGGQGV